MHCRTHDGRAFRTLNILDEFTRESLAIRVRRKLSSVDVIDVLTDLFILRGQVSDQQDPLFLVFVCVSIHYVLSPESADPGVEPTTICCGEHYDHLVG